MVKVIVRPSVLIGLVYLGLLAILVFLYDYGVTDFVHIGQRWVSNNLAGTRGYDGQFYYYIAADPLGAAVRMDNAPYRYQRIVFPLAIWGLSGGNSYYVAYLLLLTNWLSIIAGVEILGTLLVKQSMSPWYSAIYGLYFGLGVAFVFDTAEPFTYLLVIIAIWFWYKDRRNLCAGILGLAALSKETALFFSIGFLGYFFVSRIRSEIIRFVVLSVCPFVVWQLILRFIFGEYGLLFSPPFEKYPFYGILHYLDTPRKIWLLIFLIFVPTLGAWILALKRLVAGIRDPLLFGWIANIAMVTFLSHWSYMELVSSGRISIGVPLGAVTYGALYKDRQVLVMSSYYAFTMLLYLVGIIGGFRSFLI